MTTKADTTAAVRVLKAAVRETITMLRDGRPAHEAVPLLAAAVVVADAMAGDSL